ncbi:MAG: PA14 domain-containing protein, partial [Pirellulales bacterium]|nr:PA14 domain-containing protein [Pirellulales bacterium]
VDFTAARYDGDGKKTANAKITVRLNGVVVHRDVELPGSTRAAPVKEGPQDGPIYLQNHGNPVRFRNIWVRPRDVVAEARRPIVPGYERLHGSSADVAGGRVLLGELNCTACHQAETALVKMIQPKQAPILDRVGTRVHPEWLVRYLANPHQVKPGTTMPDLMSGMTEAERQTAAIALTNFLVGEDSILRSGKRGNTGVGERLFHQSGCVACHLPKDGKKANSATSIPLVGIDEKYSRGSLKTFLKDPLAVRPSGRMPHLNLGDEGATDVAQYLTGDTSAVFGDAADLPKTPNMNYSLYHGAWQEMPDFDTLEPIKTGTSGGLDLGVRDQNEQFGIRFEGFLPIEHAGKYSFRLSSDDGSILYIDGKKIIDNDGVHAHASSEGSITLTPGAHAIRVDYFEMGGEETLALDWAGPGVKSGRIDKVLKMSRDSSEVPAEPEPLPEDPDGFVFDPSKVELGRKLFSSLGCAACHQRQDGRSRIQSSLAAPPLADCDVSKGCLSNHPAKTVPNFDLVDLQTESLAMAIRAGAPRREPTADVELAHTMTALNCYACHVRDQVGGPESDRNALFVSTIPEMGDEGRLPPPLDGVGDKLRKNWLHKVVTEGDKSRPYMQTFMPGFGQDNAGHLAKLFAGLDAITDAKITTMDDPEQRIVATGRKMVGAKGLACVSCHTFGKFKTTGIQAIALDTMASRIREDWFHRYLPDPQKYRPGTRMPTGYPEGKSTVTDVYDGDQGKQLSAMWAFLEKGTAGGVPEGIVSGMIELKPEQKPIIYRNFIEGVSPRGIAVGYPEKANLCWDANHLSLTLIWQDRFIDASKHWVGRGPGNQVPLGGSVMKLEETAPVAVLSDANQAWPTQSPKQRGYKFLGYRLDSAGRPSFRYRGESFQVEDKPIPVAGELVGTFRREIKITPDKDAPEKEAPASGKIYLRVAAGNVKPQADGSFLVNDTAKIRVVSPATEPIVRKSNGRTEVLLPIDGPSTVIEEIIW